MVDNSQATALLSRGTPFFTEKEVGGCELVVSFWILPNKVDSKKKDAFVSAFLPLPSCAASQVRCTLHCLLTQVAFSVW